MTGPLITPDHPNAMAVANIVAAWATRAATSQGTIPDMVSVAVDFTALHHGGRDTEFLDTPDDVAHAVRALLGTDGSCLDTIRYSHEGVEVNRIPVLR